MCISSSLKDATAAEFYDMKRVSLHIGGAMYWYRLEHNVASYNAMLHIQHLRKATQSWVELQLALR